MYLHEFPKLGVELRLAAGDSAVERAVVAYERQYRVEVKRAAHNVFVTLLAPNGPGRQYFSVPDQFRALKFEWLVTAREERVFYQSGSQRDASPAAAVLIPHSGGEALRPFWRDRGTAGFSGRSLVVERLSWTQSAHGTGDIGRCTVRIQTLSVGLRPKFRTSREEREECDLPKESPLGFEPKVDELGRGIRLELDLTREGGVEWMVVPTSQGSFKPTVGWEQLSPAQRAAVAKLVCGEHLEDYQLDVHERHRRYKRDFGREEWEVPVDWEAQRKLRQTQPFGFRSRDPKPERFPAQLGLDGFPVRTGKTCGHLHFAAVVDPAHKEPANQANLEEEAWRRDLDGDDL